ncbi:hypothetical protein SAY87_013694 [Trapa incisa]|uniref:DUF7803 domain-containing protein n=2 Tax=Trapa TaxID=22665 RepID=A0AAN7KHR9_9MYRT|nr:hypothetical protein SAY87_013694 [Trapa incisa]
MDVDSQPTMDETVLVGDDLMLGPPSPLIPPEIASHVLEGVDLCDGILRNLFLCLQINDIEPFCQDEIVLYRQCAERRDKELRQRLQDSERKLGLSMPLDDANERASQLQAEVTSLERRLILASGVEGMEGFRQRWSLHGRLTDTKQRLESLKEGIVKRKKDEPIKGAESTPKKWFFWQLGRSLGVSGGGTSGGTGDKQGGTVRVPSFGAQNGNNVNSRELVRMPSVGAQNRSNVNSRELAGGREAMDEERKEKTAEETETETDGVRREIEYPHVSLERFIFL